MTAIAAKTPLPAWLFCPADRPDRYANAARSADVVILDLEDGVAQRDKEDARRSLVAHPLDPERTVVRLNPAGTRNHERDLQALADTPYQRVMLAKCESAAQVRALAPREIVALIESPRGAIELAEVARAGNTVGLMWGAEDLFAGLGGHASRREDGGYRDVARHLRSALLLAAKANQRLALDAVYLDIKNLAGLREEALDAAACGFDVKVAIHPSQLPVIRDAYAPDAAQVAWAQRVLAAVPEDHGVFQFEGAMIDAPILKHAERILRHGE